MENYPTEESLVTKRLTNNYLLLHRQYRLGKLEGYVGYGWKWRPSERDNIEFFEMCNEQEASKAGTLSFADAIQDLYHLTLYVEKETGTNNGSGELILRCKCLIYEATDYWLNVPPELGKYFIEYANTFPEDRRGVEKLAEELNDGKYGNKDERAKAIKLVLIAGLCGVNQLYRAHNINSYRRALTNLEKLNRFIHDNLAWQHEAPRKSFGIIGLSQYLTGQVFAKNGLIKESREAFRASTEAYVARLRQKEEFLRSKHIKRVEYEAKVSVTIRRAALVAALGDGEHYFVSGQLKRALESLTLARAALTRNSGQIYLIYVDMLYWACHRAAKSSDRTTLESCIRGLEDCYAKFGELIPESQYFHQAGIQLALALFYRAQLTGDVDGSDYQTGRRCLDEAIAYAKRPADSLSSLNPSLLASALITKSRYFSSKYVRDKKANANRSYQYLIDARHAAEEAREASFGMGMLRSEASATLGNVYIDLAEFAQTSGGTFQNNFDMGFRALQFALKENNDQNVRNEAVCYLYLTRLSLLSPSTMIAAHEYFAKWKTIANRVEHDYCKTLSNELERKLGSRILLVKAEESLNVDYWKVKVRDFLIDESLNDFVKTHFGKNYNDRELKKFLTHHLQDRLGYEGNTVAQWIKDRNLLEEVKKKLMNDPPLNGGLQQRRRRPRRS